MSSISPDKVRLLSELVNIPEWSSASQNAEQLLSVLVDRATLR